jgi:hypothetical protein
MTNCEYCEKRANFNYPLKKPKYCKKHSEAHMINVVSKKCAFITKEDRKCPKQACNGNYCRIHARRNGNYAGRRSTNPNTTRQKCVHPDCAVQPNFNFPHKKKAIYCKITSFY